MSTKDFAETLVDEFQDACMAFYSDDSGLSDVEAMDGLAAARKRLMGALRVPSAHSEDPTIHDGYAMAALPAVRIAYAQVHGIFLDADAAAKYASADASAMMKAREVKP